MPPRRSAKKTTPASERGDGQADEKSGSGKRAERSPPTEAETAAAAAATAATASRQHDTDRKTHCLFLVLENLRAHANAARPENNDGDASVAETWHRIARRSAAASASSGESSDGDDTDDDGSRNNNNNNNNINATTPPDAARLFVDTCLSASRVCREWRQVAFGAAQEAVVRLVDDESSQPPTRRGKLSRRDPLSALTPYVEPGGRGGVLRALWLRGPLPDPARLRSLARALGVVAQPTTGNSSSSSCRLFPGDASFASLLRRLQVLRVSFSWPLIYALSGVALSPSPPSPPLLGNLVHLELHAYESRWAPAPPRSSRANAPHFFTRQQLPSLKALSVSLTEDSDCPFDLLGHGGVPPALTLLRATKASPTPAPRWRGRWTPGEPLLVSLRTLRALAPSLRVLNAEKAWCSPSSEAVGEPPSLVDNDDDTPIPQPARASLVGDALIDWRLTHPSNNQDPPPQHLQPMARMRQGITALTLLSTLHLDSSHDLAPEGPVMYGPGGAHIHPGTPAWQQLRRARVREWQQASRAVLAPLGGCLRELRLDVTGARARGLISAPVALPAALSLMSSCTRLEVSASQVISVGKGLRAMVWLRHLSLRALRYQDPEDDEADEAEEEEDDEEDGEFDDDRPLTHPPVHAEDLAGLSKLTFLQLSHAAMCIADPIKAGLPSLCVLSLSTRSGCGCGRHDHDLRDPPLCVLEAALERAQKPNGGGLSMRLSKLPREGDGGGSPYVRWPVAREVDADELEELVDDHGGDSSWREARHEIYHDMLAMEEADVAATEAEDERL
jgi:hypothetical protein